MELDFDSFTSVWERVCEGNTTPEAAQNEPAPEKGEFNEIALDASLTALCSLTRVYAALSMNCAELQRARKNAAQSFSELHALYFLINGDCFCPPQETDAGGGALAKLRKAYWLETRLEAKLIGLAAEDAEEYPAAAARAKENRALLKALLSRILMATPHNSRHTCGIALI